MSGEQVTSIMMTLAWLLEKSLDVDLMISGICQPQFVDLMTCPSLGLSASFLLVIAGRSVNSSEYHSLT